MDLSIKLSEILASHVKWLADTATGDRADLSWADLSGADLSWADLSKANLSWADLSKANLSGANLSGANLSRANLSKADLSKANLSGADLSGANLSGANLSRANLSKANLSWADLSKANLSGADLSGADLGWANLRGANLSEVVGLAIASDAPERLQAVATAALADNGLDMSRWHTCNTTHCISGWAIHQAGELGRLLEGVAGPDVAGLMLLGPDAQRHFYDENEAAAEWLRSVLVPAA
jgi:hypothetical protein